MYIQKAEIRNIRSIIDFEIEFKNPAGWHVLIGDNGAGKSTIIKSIALPLVGEDQIQGLRANWGGWLKKRSNRGTIKLEILRDVLVDDPYSPTSYARYLEKDDPQNFHSKLNKIICRANFKKNEEIYFFTEQENFYGSNFSELIEKIIFSNWTGWFSAAFGPYRRFEGGNPDWQKIFENSSFAKLAAHLSVFGEDVALTETVNWLKDLNYKSLEKKEESRYILINIKRLINSEDFLPHNAKLESISSEGVFFMDGNDTTISVNQMSDGYSSILSMTFELIRQLVRVYGSELVFKNIEKGEMFIDLPGVVLVDEIDAHLHPTWQTRIGQWFLKYFPQLQFIVTTHSPLVCRAAEKGSIWRLAAPGSNEESGEITGLDRERLIYGNVLDAYGTEVFGRNVDISEESVRKQETLARLSKKQMLADLSPEEEEKLENLKKVFTTDAPIEL